MTIINTDTNAIVGGIPMPIGVFELPFAGDVGVMGTMGNTNFDGVGAGDTLIIWVGGAGVSQGIEPWAWFTAGFGLSLLCLTLVVVRRGTKLLVRGPERVDL